MKRATLPPTPGVDDRPVRQLEAPDVPAPDVPPLALQALLVGDLLAGVVDDALVLRDGLRRVDAPAVDLAIAAVQSSLIKIAHRCYS